MAANATIKDAPYHVTLKADGNWRVTAASSPTDRFHRCYTVRCDAGQVVSCTCASRTYRPHQFCKHMEAIAARLAADQRSTEAQAITPICLVNDVLRKEFRVLPGGDEVELTHWTRGELLKTEVMLTEVGRQRYLELKRAGWARF